MCSAAYFSKYASTMIDDFHLGTHSLATHEGTSPLDEFDRLERSSEIPILKCTCCRTLAHGEKACIFTSVDWFLTISVESFLPERSSYVLLRTFSPVSMLRESCFVFELEASDCMPFCPFLLQVLRFHALKCALTPVSAFCNIVSSPFI